MAFFSIPPPAEPTNILTQSNSASGLHFSRSWAIMTKPKGHGVMVTRGSPKPLLRVRVLLPLPRRRGLHLVRGGFFQKPPLTRSVAPPIPLNPAGFDGRRTGAASSRTALSSRRFFSKAAYDTTHCFSFPNIGRWTERSVGRCGQAGLSKAKKEKPLNSSSFKGLLAIVPGWPYP